MDKKEFRQLLEAYERPKSMVDLVDLRTELKNGTLRPFINRGKVYIEDIQNGECIMIYDLKETMEII